MKAVMVPVALKEPATLVETGEEWDALAKAIGGPCNYIEKVNCRLTPEHSLVLVVDEEGSYNGQKLNYRASLLYPFSPIYGPALVVQLGRFGGETDFVPLVNEDEALILVRQAISG